MCPILRPQLALALTRTLFLLCPHLPLPMQVMKKDSDKNMSIKKLWK